MQSLMTRAQAVTALVTHNNALRLQALPATFTGRAVELWMQQAVAIDRTTYAQYADLELIAMAQGVCHAS